MNLKQSVIAACHAILDVLELPVAEPAVAAPSPVTPAAPATVVVVQSDAAEQAMRDLYAATCGIYDDRSGSFCHCCGSVTQEEGISQVLHRPGCRLAVLYAAMGGSCHYAIV